MTMDMGLHRIIAVFAVLAVATAGQCSVLCAGADCYASVPEQHQTSTSGCHNHGEPAKHNGQQQQCEHQLVTTDRVEKTTAKITLDSAVVLAAQVSDFGEIVPVRQEFADYETPPLKDPPLINPVLRI